MIQTADIREIFSLLQNELSTTFSDVEYALKALDNPEENQPYQPKNERFKDLERCILVNHYCLLIIERKLVFANQKAIHTNLSNAPSCYTIDSQLVNEKSIFRDLKWLRPQHLTPSYSSPSHILLHEFKGQYARILAALTQFLSQNSFNTSVSKRNPDVYHYIWFMAAQLKKQISQIKQPSITGKFPWD